MDYLDHETRNGVTKVRSTEGGGDLYIDARELRYALEDAEYDDDLFLLYTKLIDDYEVAQCQLEQIFEEGD